MLMKRLYYMILPASLILLPSCKKFIQQQEEKAKKAAEKLGMKRKDKPVDLDESSSSLEILNVFPAPVVVAMTNEQQKDSCSCNTDRFSYNSNRKPL